MVVDLILAQQGGIPRFIKLHNGKASDSIVFGQPTKALMPRLKELGEIGILVADSELGTKDGSGRSNSSAGFSTNKREKGLTERAVEGPERWSLLSNEYRSSAIMWNTMASSKDGLSLTPPRGPDCGLQQTAAKRVVKGDSGRKEDNPPPMCQGLLW